MVRSFCLAVCCAMLTLACLPAEAFPSPNYYYHDEGQFEPEEIVNMLTRLNNFLEFERKMETLKNEITSNKRGLDLGINRGYSGSLQAKHLMAIAAAANAGGPGRRRRNAQ